MPILAWIVLLGIAMSSIAMVEGSLGKSQRETPGDVVPGWLHHLLLSRAGYCTGTAAIGPPSLRSSPWMGPLWATAIIFTS